jgi:hypothetical protein
MWIIQSPKQLTALAHGPATVLSDLKYAARAGTQAECLSVARQSCKVLKCVDVFREIVHRGGSAP